MISVEFANYARSPHRRRQRTRCSLCAAAGRERMPHGDRLCASKLPTDLYEAWQEVEINFGPTQLS